MGKKEFKIHPSVQAKLDAIIAPPTKQSKPRNENNPSRSLGDKWTPPPPPKEWLTVAPGSSVDVTTGEVAGGTSRNGAFNQATQELKDRSPKNWKQVVKDAD